MVSSLVAAIGVVPAASASAAPIGTVTAFSTRMAAPFAIATGADGNLWFTNRDDNSIGRITPEGVGARFRKDGINAPAGIAAGPDGNVWFTNVGGAGSIGRITTAGDLTIFTSPLISHAHEIVAGPDGAMWFANLGTSTVARITMDGVITSFAGIGISSPRSIAVGPDGNLWVTNAGNNTIGRVTPEGVSAAFTGSGIDDPYDIEQGSDGNLWFTNAGNDSIGRVTPAGIVSNYSTLEIDGPKAIAPGGDGNMWFTNTDDNSIGRVTPTGTVTTFTGTGVSSPNGITPGPGGLWFTNLTGNSIGRITTAGVVSNVAGNTIFSPTGVAAGPDGNLWYANTAINSIGRITPDGIASSFVVPAGGESITTGPDGNLWFAGGNSIGRISPQGVTTMFSGDLSSPRHITAGPDGNLWFVNDGNNPSFGRITPQGVVTRFYVSGVSTVGGLTGGPDGNLWFTKNSLQIGRLTPQGVLTTYTGVGIYGPLDITTGPDGNLWFTNNNNSSIGRITPTGVVSNFTASGISWPAAIAAGPDGALWFTNGNNTIGRISTTGSVSTFPSMTASGPTAITAGPDGAMWFTSAGDDSIGRISAVEPPGAASAVTAVPGKRSATVSWQPPIVDGSAPIAGYTVSATPGGASCSTTVELSCLVTGLDAGTSYSFSVVARNVAGSGAPSAPSPVVIPWDGSGYHAVNPTRILDSRLQGVGFSGEVTSSSPRSLIVTGGDAQIPPSATAVVMNVTVTDSTAESFLTVYPAGTVKPNASNLNFGPGQVIPNLVTVKVGTGGAVQVATEIGATHVVADIVGYYDDGEGPGDLFSGITPVRLLDSRLSTGGWNGQLVAGEPRDLVVRKPGNTKGVPASATAVVANVTVTEGTDQSFVSVWPSGVAQPNVSNLNLLPGQTIPNLVIVGIGSNGAIRIANAVGGVSVIVDVVGYYEPNAGSRFHATNPTRVLDTRINNGLSGPQMAGATRALAVAGRTGTNVPAGATGVVANVTVTEGTVESFVSVFPGNVNRPDPFSNLNFAPNQAVPNLVAVGLAPDGTMGIYNHLGQAALIADVVGYFAPT